MHRARLGAIDFDLSFEDDAALAGKPCQYCGSELPVIGVAERYA